MIQIGCDPLFPNYEWKMGLFSDLHEFNGLRDMILDNSYL